MRPQPPPSDPVERDDRAAGTPPASTRHPGEAAPPPPAREPGDLFPGLAAAQTRIGTVLDHKGRHVWSVAPDATVYDAVDLMAEKRVEALLVMDGPNLVGIVAERDCSRRVTLRNADPKQVRAREIMTSPVITVTPAHTVVECMRIVTGRAVPHLPVVDADTVVGVVSIGDLARAAMGDLDRTVKHLEGYITGRYPG
jgi:CBS domain-containing protein